MHTIDIYRGSDLFVTIKPEDSSVQVKRIMGDNQLQIQFKDSRNILFQINDYCTVFGDRYKLNALPTDRKVTKVLYEYNLVMQAEGFDLSKVQFLMLGQSDFSLMGKIDDFLSLIVDNANRVFSGWSKGQTIPAGFKNMTFQAENCYSALARIAQEFETEFWIAGKTVHLTKIQTDTGHTFRQGKDKGLYEITRTSSDNSTVITRLYALGSEKNIPASYGSRRLKMAGGVDYVEDNVAKYGVIEYSQIFEDIYPHRTGKVTGINAVDPQEFTDASMDFNVNDYLLPGVTAKVVFNTGDLAGYTFEIASYDNINKRFRLNKNKEETSIEIPGPVFKPALGDEYVLVDISMPQTYIDAAELELKTRAQQFLSENKEPKRALTVVLDPVYMEANGIEPQIGDVVWIVDNEFQINRAIRIIQTARNIVEEFNYQVDLADVVAVSPIAQINTGLQANARDISSISRHLENGSIFNNRVIGEFYFQELPTTNSTTGKTPLYVDDSTGKLYRLI